MTDGFAVRDEEVIAEQLGRGRLALRLELVDLAALGDVLAHRVGQAQRDRADDHRQDRGPAGEPGPFWRRRPPGLRAGHHSAAVQRGNAAAPA